MVLMLSVLGDQGVWGRDEYALSLKSVSLRLFSNMIARVSAAIVPASPIVSDNIALGNLRFTFQVENECGHFAFFLKKNSCPRNT